MLSTLTNKVKGYTTVEFQTKHRNFFNPLVASKKYIFLEYVDIFNLHNGLTAICVRFLLALYAPSIHSSTSIHSKQEF